MNFLYPQFLWGFSAVSIPILIHLLNLYRPKKIYFSNTSLLKEVQQLNKKSINIQNWLLLALRILFLLFLVLAFAQPFFSDNSNIKSQNKFATIYIDNSNSMQGLDGQNTLLDESVKAASSLVKGFNDNSHFYLIDNNTNNLGRGLLSKGKVSDYLSELEFSNSSRPFSEIVSKKPLMTGAVSGLAKSCFLFSDFQKSTFGLLKNVALDSTIDYVLVPMQNENAANIYVDSIWLEKPFLNINETNTLNIKFQNAGSNAISDVNLQMLIDSAQVASSSFSAEANSSKIVQLNFVISSRGLKNGLLKFDDFPVTFDNEYYFSLSTSEISEIAEIYGTKTTDFIENVYGNEEIYRFKSSSSSAVNVGSLAQMDAIVLNGLEGFNSALINELTQFVGAGGTLILVPSVKGNAVEYNKLLNGMGINVTLMQQDSISKVVLQAPDYENPFFNGVFELKNDRIIMPEEKPLMRWTSGSHLLSFRNSMPFLSQFRHLEGSVFLISSPLEKNSSFAKNALFVPIMYKMATYGKGFNQRLAYDFESKNITMKVPDLQRNSIIKLVKDNNEVIPVQRIQGRNVYFELPKIQLKPGIYQIKNNGKLVGSVALNYNKAESKMDFYSKEALIDLFGEKKNVKIYDSLDADNLAAKLGSQNNDLNLWKYCIAIALVLLFIEIVLIRSFKTL